jgi:small subunit ribosomal protein S13
MPRIVGVDIPKDKRIAVSLSYIYGLGPVLAGRILAEAKISPDARAKDLSDDEIAKITRIIQGAHKVEGELRREQSANIKRLMDIGCYRGSRHKKGLPVRGQQTRTNARTRKGPRPRVGVRKKLKPAAAGGPRG